MSRDVISNLSLTFLGTGTSSGVPAIACTCEVCASSDPRDQRLRTSAAVQWNDIDGLPRCVLIDCSPDLRQQALRAGLKRCDAVFFTHNHVDHTWGVDELRRFNMVQQHAIDVYAERYTLDHLHRVYKHILDKSANINDAFVATLVAHEISVPHVVEVHGVRFEPIRLLHGRLPIVGYRIEPAAAHGSATLPDSAFPLAYCTDVSGIPPETYARLRGLRTLILDALRPRCHPTHLSLDEAVSIAAEVGAGQTYFIHMSHDLPHAATCESLPEGMQLAHDGLTIPRP